MGNLLANSGTVIPSLAVASLSFPLTLVRETLNGVLRRPLVTIVEDFVGVALVAVWPLGTEEPRQLIADSARGLVFILGGAGSLCAFRHDGSIALTFDELRPSMFALSAKSGNLVVKKI